MFLLLAAALAQPPAPPKPPAGQPEFEVRFTDGSIVRAVVLDRAATVVTRFGELTVPFTDLKRVDLGFRYPAGVEAKVTAAVAKLGAAAFRDREEAERELMEHGEYALAAVRKAAKGGDPEVARRAEPLLKKLLAVVPEDQHQARDFDVIETVEFTVRGRLDLVTLNVRTRQFGTVPLRVPEVRGFRSLAAAGDAVELALDSAKYARQGWPAWLDTGVDVDAERGVTITAAGSIDQWIQEPGRYMSGPNGTQAVVASPDGRQFQSGMVVGRVGPTGPPFPVGAEFKQSRAGAGGRLFLAVAPSNWNNDSVGSYKVKVTVGD